MAAIYTPNRFAAPAPTRQPAAIAVASDLLFAAHLRDASRAAWIAGQVPDADIYALTRAERSVMHATLDSLGPVVWRGDCAAPPPATDADRAEWGALLRGGVPAASRPLPAEWATYRHVVGAAPVVTRLEGTDGMDRRPGAADYRAGDLDCGPLAPGAGLVGE